MKKPKQSIAGSNLLLSDEGLKDRSEGKEPGTSIIDQVTAGYALNNRKKLAEKHKTDKAIDSIPNSRHKEHR